MPADDVLVRMYEIHHASYKSLRTPRSHFGSRHHTSRSYPAMSFDEAYAELVDAKHLADAQVGLGLDRGEVVAQMFDIWKGRVAKLGKATSTQKKQLADAIKDGPWTPTQRMELGQSVLVLGSSASSNIATGSGYRRPNQRCLAFQNMIPTDVFAKLRNAVTYSSASRCHLIATVASKLGIVNPSLPLLFHMVQIKAFCEGNYNYDQQAVWDDMDKIQDYIKGCSTSKDLPYIVDYPASPDQLPDAIRERAFADGFPPQLHIPELSTILGNNKMKGRDQVGKHASLWWLQEVPYEFRQQIINALPRHRMSSKQAHAGITPDDFEPDRASARVEHERPQPHAQPLPSAAVLRRHGTTYNAHPHAHAPSWSSNVKAESKHKEPKDEDMKGEEEDDKELAHEEEDDKELAHAVKADAEDTACALKGDAEGTAHAVKADVEAGCSADGDATVQEMEAAMALGNAIKPGAVVAAKAKSGANLKVLRARWLTNHMMVA